MQSYPELRKFESNLLESFWQGTMNLTEVQEVLKHEINTSYENSEGSS
jgi:hypothetical protein